MWVYVAVRAAAALLAVGTIVEEAARQSASCPGAFARRPGTVIELTAANGYC